MADTYNEDDELSRVIEWLKANGVALIVGALLGLAIIVGWQWWNAHTDSQARQAASLYGDVIVQIERGQLSDDVLAGVAQLKTDYAGSPYAVNAAFRLAAHYAGASQYDKALAELKWVADNAEALGIRHLARIRQARVLWSQGKPAAALELLAAEHPDTFDRLYAELAGDIQAEQGDPAAAHAAYQRAAATLPTNAGGRILARKLASTAPPESSAQAGAQPVSAPAESPSVDEPSASEGS